MKQLVRGIGTLTVLLLIVGSRLAGRLLIIDSQLTLGKFLEGPQSLSENSSPRQESSLSVTDYKLEALDLRGDDEGRAVVYTSAKEKIIDFGTAAPKEAIAHSDEQEEAELIGLFRSLARQEKKELCEESPLSTNKIFLSRFMDENKKAEKTEELVKKLCRRKGAGFEIKVRMFPCMFDTTEHLIETKEYIINGTPISINNVLKDPSFFRLNFPHKPDRPYDLGYHKCSRFFMPDDARELKSFLEANYNADFDDVKDVPQACYEFRTFGKLDHKALTNARDDFKSWYNPLVAKYQQEFADKPLPNDVYYFEYKSEADNQRIPVCLQKEGVSNEFLKSNINYKLQLTLSFDIADLPQVIRVLVQSEGLASKGSFNDLLPSFLSYNYIANGAPNDPDDLCYVSGMEYLSKFDWMPTRDGQPAPSEYPHQTNLLRLYGAFWFKQTSIESVANACNNINTKSAKRRLKAYTLFAPRIGESSLIHASTVHRILTKVAPFFDVYLPYEVRPAADSLDDWSLEQILYEYEKILQVWKDHDSLVFAEEIKKGEDYVEYVRAAMFDVSNFDRATYQYNPAHKLKLRAETSFRLSFSLYLLNILLNPKKDTTILNDYYEIRDMKGNFLKKPFRTTHVPTDLQSTLVFEYLKIPKKANSFDNVFDSFFDEFFEEY